MAKKGKKSASKTSSRKILVFFLLLSILIILGIYLYFVHSYWDKFIDNTKVAGYDVSRMTLAEAENFFANKSSDYHIDISFRMDETETIDSSDIDFKYNSDSGLTRAITDQNPFAWPVTLFKGSQYDLESTFSEEKLKKKLKSFKEFDKKNMIAPVDAYAKWDESDFVIEPEVMGTKFSVKDAISAVSDAIHGVKTSIDLEEFYENPEIYSDDKSLNDQVPQLNELIPNAVTYEFPDGSTKTLDGTVLIDWLDKSGDTYTKDEEKWNEHITEYVKELGASTDTIGVPHKFHTNMDTDIEVRATGYYGWRISQEAEAKQLAEDLASGENVSRIPVYSMTEAASPDNNNGFGKDYIEIDLTRQHLWVYQKGKVAFETDVVSGKDTPERRTPDGTFMTYDKQKDKVLRGDVQPDGSYGYESHVNFWIRLTNTGVGLHDATWRSNFGGKIWITNGSHGCVNLPYNAAKTIYEMVPERMPVIIYYS